MPRDINGSSERPLAQVRCFSALHRETRPQWRAARGCLGAPAIVVLRPTKTCMRASHLHTDRAALAEPGPCPGSLIFVESLERLADRLAPLQPPPGAAAAGTLHVVLPAAALLPDGGAAPGAAHPDRRDAPDDVLPANVLDAVSAALASSITQCQTALQAAGVACVTFLCLQRHSSVLRRGYRWSAEEGAFAPARMLSCLDAPTAAMMDAASLPDTAAHVPSHAQQLHSFVVQVRQRARPCQTCLHSQCTKVLRTHP